MRRCSESSSLLFQQETQAPRPVKCSSVAVQEPTAVEPENLGPQGRSVHVREGQRMDPTSTFPHRSMVMVRGEFLTWSVMSGCLATTYCQSSAAERRRDLRSDQIWPFVHGWPLSYSRRPALRRMKGKNEGGAIERHSHRLSRLGAADLPLLPPLALRTSLLVFLRLISPYRPITLCSTGLILVLMPPIRRDGIRRAT